MLAAIQNSPIDYNIHAYATSFSLSTQIILQQKTILHLKTVKNPYKAADTSQKVCDLQNFALELKIYQI